MHEIKNVVYPEITFSELESVVNKKDCLNFSYLDECVKPYLV